MGKRVCNRSVAVLASLLLSVGGAAWARAVTWSPHATWKGRQVVLGPTGARGWVEGHRIHVADVAPGSPADGLLEAGDVLLGANGTPFPEGQDPRVALGNAIAESETEARRGRLTLTVQRGRESRTVGLTLRVLGAYSPTWPADCPKSARVVEKACAYLASVQYPDGHVQGELGMATMWDGLLWLASGDARYLDNARRAAYWLSEQDYEGVGLNSWPAGYNAIFLAEYHLATGDRTVLPQLEKLAKLLAMGQMKCASWGHSSPWGGYGAVNQVGLACFIGLILTRECGVAVNEKAIEASRAFFKKYAGKGWVPYGDHVPWRGPSGNGKNALAAVAFHLLGGEEDAVRAFSRSVAASYPHREDGHTGAYFSFFWGPLAASLASREELRTFLDHQRWYYDLARTWDGGLVCQPNPENLSGRTPGIYTWCGPEYTTGGMALFYALPRKTLRILGAPHSAFGRDVPAPVAKARALYEGRKWDELAAAVAALPAGQRPLGEQLRAAARRQRESVTLTLEAIENDIREGDVYRASELLESLERLVGKDNPQLAAAQKLMADNQRWVDEGRKYYEAWSTIRDYSWQYWHHYGQRAMAQLERTLPRPPRLWTAIAATSEATPQTWKAHQWGDPEGEPPARDVVWDGLAGWQKPGFDDGQWADLAAPVKSSRGKAKGWHARHILLRRTFSLPTTDFAALRLRLSAARDQETEVYLNGELVGRAIGGAGRGYAAIALDPSAVGLLRKGENLLAVHSAKGAKGQGSLDLGLEGAQR